MRHAVTTVWRCRVCAIGRGLAICVTLLLSAGPASWAQSELVTEFEDAPRLLAHLPLEPYAAAFTRDGDRFATGHDDGSIVLWRTSDGLPLLRLNGHSDTVIGMSFDVAGNRLASAAYDGTVRIWETATGSVISVLQPEADRLTCVALAPDGLQVAAGGYDGIVRVWHDVNAPAVMSAPADAPRVIRCLAYSPDGQQIASGDDGGALRLLNAADGSLLHTATRHQGAVRCLAFSPDGRWLLSGGAGGDVRGCDTQMWQDAWDGGNLIPTHAYSVVRIAFLQDGRLFASADQSGEVRVWDFATRKMTSELSGHSGRIAETAFAPDAQAVVSIGADRLVNVWKARLPPTPRLASIADVDGNLWAVAIASDSSVLYAAGKKGLCGAWDLRTGKLLRRFEGFAGTIDAIDLSADGKYLAVCGWRDKTAAIFDVQTGEKRAEKAAEDNLRCVRFSPDGLTLAAGCQNGRVLTWVWQSDEAARTINVSERAVYDLRYSPDGERLAACGGDWRKQEPGYIKLLNARELSVTGELSDHKHAVRTVTFNHDGTRMASADESGAIVIWDATTLLPLTRIKNASGARPLAYSPNGSQLAVGLHDGSIHVWDVSTGELVRRFRSDDDLFALAFDGDGAVLYSASGEPRVEIWPVAEASPAIEQVRGWVP